MVESDKARTGVYRAVNVLHDRNRFLEAENSKYRLASLENRESIKFHKQQSEFWAGECISEQRKAHVSHVVMIIACVLSGAAIGMNMLMCQ